MRITDNQVTDIIGLASKYPAIVRVGVFGSYARGEQTAESDIDIVYDYDKPNRNDDAYVLDILAYAEDLTNAFDKLNIEVDCISYQGVLESSNGRIQNNIMDEIVWVYEKPFGER